MGDDEMSDSVHRVRAATVRLGDPTDRDRIGEGEVPVGTWLRGWLSGQVAIVRATVRDHIEGASAPDGLYERAERQAPYFARRVAALRRDEGELRLFLDLVDAELAHPGFADEPNRARATLHLARAAADHLERLTASAMELAQDVAPPGGNRPDPPFGP
ncbi:MAG: hypothetical protein S0880_08925 [Actinomycetota bacterium]|nr:hypothetical protein [Actinomycetota bacterium]